MTSFPIPPDAKARMDMLDANREKENEQPEPRPQPCGDLSRGDTTESPDKP